MHQTVKERLEEKLLKHEPSALEIVRNRSIGYRLSPPHRRGESMCDYAPTEKKLLKDENPEESDENAESEEKRY